MCVASRNGIIALILRKLIMNSHAEGKALLWVGKNLLQGDEIRRMQSN